MRTRRSSACRRDLRGTRRVGRATRRSPSRRAERRGQDAPRQAALALFFGVMSPGAAAARKSVVEYSYPRWQSRRGGAAQTLASRYFALWRFLVSSGRQGDASAHHGAFGRSLGVANESIELDDHRAGSAVSYVQMNVIAVGQRTQLTVVGDAALEKKPGRILNEPKHE
jgi:hypothetical protein